MDPFKLIEEASVELSKRFAQIVAKSSYEIWERKDFRLYVDFYNISETEQDRIFNELQVSALGIFALHIDYASQLADKDFRKIIKSFKDRLIEEFLNLFRELGIAENLVDEWHQLINLRFDEYNKDYKIAIEESKKKEEFKSHEEHLRIAWARIETITIDCLTHIRRGEVEEKDPLWRFLRKWFIIMDANISKIEQLGQSSKD